MRRGIKYWSNKVFVSFILTATIGICLCSCTLEYDAESKQESFVEEVIVQSKQENCDENPIIESKINPDDINNSLGMYPYEIEQKLFSFYTTQDKTYQIPYVRVYGSPDEELQWKINHALWENACWILECAELEDSLYALFRGDNALQITGVYKYQNYLSVLYEGTYESSIQGKIAYAIVVDMLTGERVLLEDMVKDKNELKELLVHYFDNDHREIRLFIFEEDAENILFYGGMTEKETIINNLTLNGNYSEEFNGTVGSVSYLFDSASFYMTEEAFVILPGAKYYEPLFFQWEEIEGVLK